MIRRTFVAEDEVEETALEQHLPMVRELRELADATPDGHVPAVVESAAVEHGRRFVRARARTCATPRPKTGEKGAQLGLPLRRSMPEP